MTRIIYNGATITEVPSGQTATLKCAGMIMADDVVVEVAEQNADSSAQQDEILGACNEALVSKGVETAETLEQVPQRIGEIDVTKEELFFTQHGQMYTRNMVIPTTTQDGFNQGAYRYADRLETVSAPNVTAEWNALNYVFRDCTALKNASLPKIKNIGAGHFQDDTALEEVTLGCEDVPMVVMNATAFRNCSALVRFNYVGSISTSISFAQSPLLDDESRQTIVNSLADLTGKTAQTLTLHPDVGAKLTEAQKATITAKNWTLVY